MVWPGQCVKPRHTVRAVPAKFKFSFDSFQSVGTIDFRPEPARSLKSSCRENPVRYFPRFTTPPPSRRSAPRSIERADPTLHPDSFYPIGMAPPPSRRPALPFSAARLPTIPPVCSPLAGAPTLQPDSLYRIGTTPPPPAGLLPARGSAPTLHPSAALRNAHPPAAFSLYNQTFLTFSAISAI
jgi:hypothetical protein